MGRAIIFFICLVGLSLAAGVGVGAPAGQQVLVRDGFEHGDEVQGLPQDWHPSPRLTKGIPIPVWVETGGRGGSRCIGIVTEKQQGAWESKAFPAGPDRTYQWEGYVATRALDGKAFLSLAFFTERGHVIRQFDSPPASGTATWSKLRVRIRPPQETAWVSVACVVSGTGGALFDDVLLTSAPAPVIVLTEIDHPARVQQGRTLKVIAALEPQTILGEGVRIGAALEKGERGYWAVQAWAVPAEVPIVTWVVGSRYQVQIDLQVPLYLEPGDYLLHLQAEGAYIDATNVSGGRFPVRVTKQIPPSRAVSAVLERVECPSAAHAGDTLAVTLTLRTKSRLFPSKPVVVWLVRDNVLWVSRAFDGVYGIGEMTIGPLDVLLPPGLPVGHYQVWINVGAAVYEGKAPTDFQVAQVDVKGEEGTTPPRPLAQGVFVDETGVPHPWNTTATETMLWGGEPYLPVGGLYAPRYLREFNGVEPSENETAFAEFEAALDLCAERGVRDIIISSAQPITRLPPTALQRVIDALEKRGFRYGLGISAGPEQPLRAFLVGRKTWISLASSQADNTVPVDFDVVDGGTGIWLARYGQDSVAAGEVEEHRPLSLLSGANAVVVSFRESTLREFPLYVVPEVRMPEGSATRDLWEGFAPTCQELREFLADLRFGPGLRFFLDPLGHGFNWEASALVPSSPAFRDEFARWLQAQFPSPKAVAERWGVGGQVPLDFSALASLIPIKVLETRGYAYCLATHKPVVMDAVRSQFYLDLMDFREESVAAKYREVAGAIKSVVDVPVLVRHNHAYRPWFAAAAKPPRGIDGICMEPHGAGDMLAMVDGVVAEAECRQSPRALWCIAAGTSEAWGSTEWSGYPDVSQLEDAVVWLLWAGAKGVFVDFVSPGELSPQPQVFPPEQLEALANLQGKVQEAAGLRDYLPPLAIWAPHRPAELEAFTAGRGDFVGIDGDWAGEPARRMRGGWVVPGEMTRAINLPLVVNLERSPASVHYGALLSEILREGRQRVVYVGHRIDLGIIPELDRFFTDRFTTGPAAYRGAGPQGESLQVLKPTPESEILQSTPTGQCFHLRQGNLEIISVRTLRPEELVRLIDLPELGGYLDPRAFSGEVLGLSTLSVAGEFPKRVSREGRPTTGSGS